jgi:hypothetical protein
MSKPYFNNAKKEDNVFDLALGRGQIVDVNHDKDENYCWIKVVYPTWDEPRIYNHYGQELRTPRRTLYYEDDYKKYIEPALNKAMEAMRRGIMFSIEYQLETPLKLAAPEGDVSLLLFGGVIDILFPLLTVSHVIRKSKIAVPTKSPGK